MKKVKLTQQEEEMLRIKVKNKIMENKNAIKLVEVARSFSRTAQVKAFEPRNFFCSVKEECEPKDLESTSQRLIHFCKMQVEKEVEEYIEAHKPDSEKVIDANSEQAF
jgi:hypothetical protein